MENKCWFCETNEALSDFGYLLELKKVKNRKDKKIVEIDRCKECANKHRKGDRLSSLLYILEIGIVAVSYFVFNIELLYIVLIYIALTRPLTSLMQKIRDRIASPYKSVCTTSTHEEVGKLLEEGYIEARKF